jgi:PKHD-type hydroxylase
MLLQLKDLLTAELAGRIVSELADAPFVEGKATAHGPARSAKDNLQLDPAHPISQRLGGLVLAELGRNESFKAAAVPHTILPMRFCRYTEGMRYGEHLDLPVMATSTGPLRTDLSVTVWLTPSDSYDGGELVLFGDAGGRKLKGDVGDAIIYSSDTRHAVAPVTRGERLVAISWIQSMVRDEAQRRILFELAQTTAQLRGGEVGEQVGRLDQIHHRLLRLWAEC